jgi:NAD+ synthase
MTITAPTSATDIVRIAVAQLNPTVGDVAGNLAKAREARADAQRHGADIVLFTELFIAGYPPEDLVLKPAFIRSCLKAVNELAADTADGGSGGDHRLSALATTASGTIRLPCWMAASW